MHVLRNKCECGGYVTVIPCRDKDREGRIESVVSHGVCVSCLKNVVLPTEPYLPFVKKFCISVALEDLDEEVYVDRGECIPMTQSAFGQY